MAEPLLYIVDVNVTTNVLGNFMFSHKQKPKLSIFMAMKTKQWIESALNFKIHFSEET